MKTLEQTLKYQNPELKKRIRKSLGGSHQKINMVYRDVLRWLWLCAKLRSEARDNAWLSKNLTAMRMPSSWLPIDIGWHEFILCTRQYSNFCDQYLDGYIHHGPAKLHSKTLESQGEDFSSDYLEVYYSFIGNNIGYKRLNQWLLIYPEWTNSIENK